MQHYLECQKTQWVNLGYGNLLSCPRGKKFPEDREACESCQEFKPYERMAEFLTGLVLAGLEGGFLQCQS